MSGESWRESQRVIVDNDRKRTESQPNQHLDLVIKVSVPDWKVMAFSTKPDGQLVWEHQVRKSIFTSKLVALTLTWRTRPRSVLYELDSGDQYRLITDRLCRVVLHTHRLGLAGGRR